MEKWRGVILAAVLVISAIFWDQYRRSMKQELVVPKASVQSSSPVGVNSSTETAQPLATGATPPESSSQTDSNSSSNAPSYNWCRYPSTNSIVQPLRLLRDLVLSRAQGQSLWVVSSAKDLDCLPIGLPQAVEFMTTDIDGRFPLRSVLKASVEVVSATPIQKISEISSVIEKKPEMSKIKLADLLKKSTRLYPGGLQQEGLLLVQLRMGLEDRTFSQKGVPSYHPLFRVLKSHVEARKELDQLSDYNAFVFQREVGEVGKSWMQKFLGTAMPNAETQVFPRQAIETVNVALLDHILPSWHPDLEPLVKLLSPLNRATPLYLTGVHRGDYSAVNAAAVASRLGFREIVVVQNGISTLNRKMGFNLKKVKDLEVIKLRDLSALIKSTSAQGGSLILMDVRSEERRALFSFPQIPSYKEVLPRLRPMDRIVILTQNNFDFSARLVLSNPLIGEKRKQVAGMLEGGFEAYETSLFFDTLLRVDAVSGFPAPQKLPEGALAYFYKISWGYQDQ